MMMPNRIQVLLQKVLSEMRIETYEPHIYMYGGSDNRYESWQDAVEVIFRLLKSNLVEFWPSNPLVSLGCENFEDYALALSENDPYYLSHMVEINDEQYFRIFEHWSAPLLILTDVTKKLIDKYQIGYSEENLSLPFIQEVEIAFVKNNVPWSDKPLFPIMF